MLILKIFKFTRIDFKAFCFEFESFMISNYKKKLKDEKKKKKKSTSIVQCQSNVPHAFPVVKKPQEKKGHV